MARFHTDENFLLPVVEVLRAMGHDVFTANLLVRIAERRDRCYNIITFKF